MRFGLQSALTCLSKGKPQLTRKPGLKSWDRFTQIFAPRINTLRLDLKTLCATEASSSRPRWVLQDVFKNAPEVLPLRNLRRLHATLDLDVLHMDILRHFAAPDVEHLSLELYVPKESQKCAESAYIERDKFFPLGATFELVRTRFPHLRSLRLVLPDTAILLTAWDRFIDCLVKLPKLRTLIVPTFALSRALLPALSGHPTLAEICALDHDVDPVWGCSFDDTTATSLPVIPDRAGSQCLLLMPISLQSPRSRLDVLTHLTIASYLPHLTELFMQVHLENLRSLRVILVEPIHSLHEVQIFFETVAAHFPDLRSLSVGLIRYNCAERISYHTLRPLRGCRALESLSIQTTLPIRLTPTHFEELVSSWPRMRTLRLDETEPDVLFPNTSTDPQPDPVPFGHAVLALQTHCPHLARLSMHVSPTLPRGGAASPRTPWTSLQELHVRFAEPHTVAPRLLAAALRTLCADACRVRVAGGPPDELWAMTLPIGVAIEDGTAARRVRHARAYAEQCVEEWERLVRCDGKRVCWEWSETVRAQVAFVVSGSGARGEVLQKERRHARKLLGSR